MAEKNTLSILETIKKKMGKLDQKPKPENKIADLSEEFQYITPTKKAAEAVAEKKEEIVATKPAIKFEDDLGIEDPKKPAAPAAAAPTPAKTEKKLEDFNLDDLDLDDETALAKKPAAPVEAKVEEGFSEEDVEDYEDSVDLSEDEKKPEEKPREEKVEDDLNLDELEIDNLEEEPKAPADQEQEDDLDLSALDFEDEKAAEIPQKKAEAEDELNLDDLELEPEEITPKPAEEKDPLDELSLEELEKIPAESAAKIAAPQVAEEKDPLDDISLEELEKESEIAAAKIVKKEPEKEDNLDDIDLSDLEEESAREVALASEKGKIEKQISPQDEIDLEFGREIMGARPEISRVNEQKFIPNQQVQPEEEFEIDQPIHQELPQQNFAPTSEAQEQGENFSEDWLSAPLPQEEPHYAASNVSKMERRGEIIHETTARQTTDSIKRLLDAKNIISGISTFSKNPELSEIAMNLLEPKLEKWCNENLSELVEKVVREEIKKLIPKE